MVIYLADLLHTGTGERTPNTMPLSIAFIASYVKKVSPEIEVTLFRNPDELMFAVYNKKPDLVGFSTRLWSENLVCAYAIKIKEYDPNIVTVVGGPSIDDIDNEIEDYLQKNTYFDVVIPNEGEVAFVNLLNHLREYRSLSHEVVIAGCCTRHQSGKMLRGAYTLPNLKEIPSPYLNGFLDRFLSEGYEPIVQTMRGCPYSCSFCVSGTPQWRRLRAFDLQRVFAEIQYIHARTESDYLILTDENFGVLKERDVNIARFIADYSKRTGFPKKLYYYSAKMITPSVLEIVNILNELGTFGISFQTLDEKVRKEIHRVNVPYSKFEEYIAWAKSQNVSTSTEMIFGFPYETLEGYIQGIEKLILSGVDHVYNYNLRLLNGTDLSTQANRIKYNYKTKFRMPERNFGLYDDVAITESEEIVVGSCSFDFNDYLTVRCYGLFLEICSGRRYFSQFIQLMIHLGLHGEKLIAHLSKYDYSFFPELQSVISQYVKAAHEELFDSTDELQKHVQKLLDSKSNPPEVKLNFIYAGKILFQQEISKQFFEVIKRFIKEQTEETKIQECLFGYLDNVLLPRIVTFKQNEPDTVAIVSNIDLEKLETKNFSSVDDLLLAQPIQTLFKIHPAVKKFIINIHKNSHAASDSLYQDIFMKNQAWTLLRIKSTTASVTT